MKKPILYVEAVPHCKNRLAFDFCYSAKLGAEQCGIQVKSFQHIEDVPTDLTNIIVGSVESCKTWLISGNYPVPEIIPPMEYLDFLGRSIYCDHINEVVLPAFIKPYKNIKAFTGFYATDKLTLKVFSENYDDIVWVQEFIDIVSEYRMYISNNKIIGMRHYIGDCLQFPDSNFIRNCLEHFKSKLDYHSYTLDFGVLENGKTVLIEVNDGWAIGNYGLEPQDYYLFCRNRWLQMTGIRKRMDY